MREYAFHNSVGNREVLKGEIISVVVLGEDIAFDRIMEVEFKLETGTIIIKTHIVSVFQPKSESDLEILEDLGGE